MAIPGHKPILNPDGSYKGPSVPDSMVDPGTAPGLREQLALGVGKACYAVTDSKHDYRNRRRSRGVTSAKVR